MKVHYAKQKVEYGSLKEMTDHIFVMKEQGWKAERLQQDTTEYLILFTKGSKEESSNSLTETDKEELLEQINELQDFVNMLDNTHESEPIVEQLDQIKLKIAKWF